MLTLNSPLIALELKYRTITYVRSSYIFCNHHSHPNGFYWGHQCSKTFTPQRAGLQREVLRPQQDVTKIAFPEKSGVKIRSQHILVIRFTWTERTPFIDFAKHKTRKNKLLFGAHKRSDVGGANNKIRRKITNLDFGT